jgi:adenylate kinase
LVRVTRVNVILMGPPGCGKGTQAARLASRYAIPHISTGDILRAAVTDRSALGRQVEAIMSSGGLVTDDIMTELVRERLGRRDTAPGFVLDGFPRTIAQAHALDEMPSAAPSVVALIAVTDEEIVRRLSTRRVCGTCRLTQSVASSSDPDREACPYCGGRLERRKDDSPEVVRRRLATYASFAEPLIGHYDAKALLASVDGLGQLEDVTAALCAWIDSRTRGIATE